MQNELLIQLPPSEQLALESVFVDFQFIEGYEFEHQGKRVQSLFFVETGCASLTVTSGLKEISVGITGNEGCIGGMPLASESVSAWGAYALVNCTGRYLPIYDAVRCLPEDAAFWKLLALYSATCASQVGHTSLANGTATLLMRVARLILMVHDRLTGSSVLLLTHEAVARVLSVQRPGVTVALHVLEGERAIVSRRGSIEVLHRKTLMQHAGLFYRVQEQTHRESMLSVSGK